MQLRSCPTLLWLWCRPAAVALTGPLAWEPPYAVGAALEKAKRAKKKKEKKKEKQHIKICGLYRYQILCTLCNYSS